MDTVLPHSPLLGKKAWNSVATTKSEASLPTVFTEVSPSLVPSHISSEKTGQGLPWPTHSQEALGGPSSSARRSHPWPLPCPCGRSGRGPLWTSGVWRGFWSRSTCQSEGQLDMEEKGDRGNENLKLVFNAFCLLHIANLTANTLT